MGRILDNYSREKFGMVIEERERELLEELVNGKSLDEACNSLGISRNSGIQYMFRLLRRYENAKGFIEDVEYYRNRLPSRYL